MDMAQIFQALLALIFVMGLIGLASFLARKYGLDGTGFGKKSGNSRRLAIQEIRMLDPKRKLVLIRRDDVEHLLLVGGEAPLVIERGITSTVTQESTILPKIEEEQSDGQ